MTWKDKLEIGLKDDASFRRDNLPDFQKERGGPTTQPGDPTRSPEEPGARKDAEVARRIALEGARKKRRAPARAGARPATRPARKRR